MPDIRVRIAVAVDAEGHYWARAGVTDEELAREALTELDADCEDVVAVHFVTATVPLPEPPSPLEIEGEVEG